jgi:hypothetical protein
LEGSVRRLGYQIRVNAQLIDAETDVHLWAERFDGLTNDLLALQDEVTRRIAVELNLELVTAEAARPSNHPDVLDYILRGRAVRNRPASPDVYAEAISLLEHAAVLDPRSVEAQSLLARFLSGRVLDRMSDASAVNIARAEELVGEPWPRRPATTATTRTITTKAADGVIHGHAPYLAR